MTLENYVGTLVKNLPNLHGVEYNIGFSIHSNSFFQKLVEKDILEKGVRINPDDYYKGIVFLNYFSVIEDSSVCDNLVKISKGLRSAEKEAGEDVDASYLDLKAIILTAGLEAKEKNHDYSRQEVIDGIKAKYSNETIVDFEKAKKAELYYEALGKMVTDLVGNGRKKHLNEVKSRNELEAVVFSDCIVSLIQDKEFENKINERLGKKEYFGASIESLAKLREYSTKEQLKEVLTALFCKDES